MEGRMRQTEGGQAAITQRLEATETGIAKIKCLLDEIEVCVATTLTQIKEENRERRHRRERKRQEEEESEGSNGDNRRRVYHQENRRKLEIPIFVGIEVQAWLIKFEQYFRFNEIQEEKKVEIAMVFLDGKALAWFRWWEWEMCNPQPSWNEFRRDILKEFQPQDQGNQGRSRREQSQIGLNSKTWSQDKAAISEADIGEKIKANESQQATEAAGKVLTVRRTKEDGKEGRVMREINEKFPFAEEALVKEVDESIEPK